MWVGLFSLHSTHSFRGMRNKALDSFFWLPHSIMGALSLPCHSGCVEPQRRTPSKVYDKQLKNPLPRLLCAVVQTAIRQVALVVLSPVLPAFSHSLCCSHTDKQRTIFTHPSEFPSFMLCSCCCLYLKYLMHSSPISTCPNGTYSLKPSTDAIFLMLPSVIIFSLFWLHIYLEFCSCITG